VRERERELEPVKLLTEKQIHQNQIDRTLRPYKNGATKVAKGIGRLGRAVLDGLEKLGEIQPKPKKLSLKARIAREKLRRQGGIRRRL